VGPDDVNGEIADPACNGMSSDCTFGLLTEGNVSPPASLGGTKGLADRSNAPPTTLLDDSPTADKHRATEEVVGVTNASSVVTDNTPTSHVGMQEEIGNLQLGGQGQLSW
jgi:hypothetical protein